MKVSAASASARVKPASPKPRTTRLGFGLIALIAQFIVQAAARQHEPERRLVTTDQTDGLRTGLAHRAIRKKIQCAAGQDDC